MQDLKTRIEDWLANVNAERAQYWNANYTYKPYEPLVMTTGRKWIKIMDGTSVWGFIAQADGIHKGAPVLAGDLLKPANWQAPAKWSRGNILVGTTYWSFWGPLYLN